jgi:chaperonin cofactor prefoldin
MKKVLFNILILLLFTFCSLSAALALEVAPRISDREIVERLSRLEEGQKRLESRIDDLRSEMISRFESVDKRFDAIDKRFDAINKRFDAINKRFDAIDKRFDDLRADMNSRFDLITWIFGIFVTVSLVMLGFVIRMQWQMQRRQTQMETSLETQKDEMAFLKRLIEKLLPPSGAL